MRAAGKGWIVGMVSAGLLAAACSASTEDSLLSPPGKTAPSTSTTTTARLATTEVTPASDRDPSQSAEDAERDGVVPALAELPTSIRVDPVSSVNAEEGLWVLSRPSDEALDFAPGCGLGDPNGIYGRDIICVLEYGEVLLMDESGQEIIRAFPLPSLPPQHLVIADDAAFCGRQGDGGLPDSMLCRIDRASFDWTVRVFPWKSGSLFGPGGAQGANPPNWIVEDPTDAAYFEQIEVTETSVVVEGSGGRREVDTLTLELQPFTD